MRCGIDPVQLEGEAGICNRIQDQKSKVYRRGVVSACGEVGLNSRVGASHMLVYDGIE